MACMLETALVWDCVRPEREVGVHMHPWSTAIFILSCLSNFVIFHMRLTWVLLT